MGSTYLCIYAVKNAFAVFLWIKRLAFVCKCWWHKRLPTKNPSLFGGRSSASMQSAMQRHSHAVWLVERPRTRWMQLTWQQVEGRRHHLALSASLDYSSHTTFLLPEEPHLQLLIFAFLCSRLQDQSSPRQDQHVHQDSGARRRARLRRHRKEGGRGQGQARDPVRGRTFLTDSGVSQEQFGGFGLWGQHSSWPSRQHSRTRDYSGTSTVSRGRSSGWAKGRHHQAHPTPDPHVHRDTEPR